MSEGTIPPYIHVAETIAISSKIGTAGMICLALLKIPIFSIFHRQGQNMREIVNASNAALSKMSWLYSETASVPFVTSIITRDVIRKIIGIDDAIGDGSPLLKVCFANVSNV